MKNFYDKFGEQIHIGDILTFESGSTHIVTEYNGVVCLKCHSKKLPLFVLEKIANSGILVSAYRNNN